MNAIFQNFQFFWEQRCREFNRRKKCSHLKGSNRGAKKDYAVSFHTMITGDQRIACLKGCGFEVYNKPEWSLKWAYGLRMVAQSTNTSSSSEVIRRMAPFAISEPRVKTKEEIEAAYKNNPKDEKDIIRGWVNKDGSQPESTDDIIIL